MTSHSTVSADHTADVAAAAPAKRPGLLFAALAVAAVAALATLANGIVMKTGGEQLAIEILAEALDMDVAMVQASAADSFITQSMVETLDARAMMAFVVGGLLLLFTLLGGRAAIWARVLVTIFAAINILVGVMIAGDDGTNLLLLLGALATFASIATLVLVWLPPVNRYARQLKNSR
ncbi:hypothetical protein AB8O38_15205 [Saccharomonospora xinjiangensis]|uniref:hypothetical protein n=1 Tax=Saccharomonospora xinjiangensis TaxID=75294 RepID=UPI00350FE419